MMEVERERVFFVVIGGSVPPGKVIIKMNKEIIL
jgi:hypothetical protein